ncbi:MAG TPA: hypothetical protein PK280_12910 [Planctomycetota bacterium]|nr:hypothetical protein [Planctomycetota bacterium]
MKALLERLRLPLLCLLAASAPLGAWAGYHLEQPGTKTAFFLGAFDLVVWVALAAVLLSRFLSAGVLGVFRALWRAPLAGWLLAALVLWSGLVWPRMVGARFSGDEPASVLAVLKELLQTAEYAVAALVAAAELIRFEDRARRAALASVAGACVLIMAVGVVQYFSGRSDFQVGSLLGGHSGAGEFLPNRNAFGAFLAVMVPFAATMALGRAGVCCCWWNLGWAGLAAAGVLLVLSGGALLGVVAGCLAGAAVLGRRKLALAAAALAVLLAAAQALPRHGLSAAVESVHPVRRNPRDGEPLLAVRYLRYASELTVLSRGLSGGEGAWKLFFGLGPGGYGREKNLRPNLDSRFAETVGQTDVPENFDVLANEPNSFDLWLGQAAVLGLPGLACLLWLFAWWGGAALRTWKRSGLDSPERSVAAAAFAAVVGAALAGIFTSPWIQGAGPTLVVLVAAAMPPPVGRGQERPGPDPAGPGGGSGAVRV